MCLNDQFSGITHLISPMALIKTGPIMAIFKKIKAKLSIFLRILTK